MITANNLTFAFPGQPPILENVCLSLSDGTYTALMGPNGSGKTTLAFLIKSILPPTSGELIIDNIHPADDASRFEIMKRVGLVFQNPENTIVSTTVENELAFGLENLGIPQAEMKKQVDVTLQRFHLEKYRHTNPTNLSGGEKQRLALASVMIMRPKYLILDEPTSLLDPPSRASLLEAVHDAVDDGTTVLHITQFSNEAVHADRLIVLDDFGITQDGTPEVLLKGNRKYRTGGMEFINASGTQSPGAGSIFNETRMSSCVEKNSSPGKPAESGILSFQDVGYRYDRGTPFENCALEHIDVTIRRGTSTAVFGSSGSGKTTFLEIAAGITAPTGGIFRCDGNSLCAMAFQFPENQMSDQTVASYIEFGLRNIGVPEHEFPVVISETLCSVGLEPEKFKNRDPFTLSGGEQRRAALAGILAMKPDVLVLDEPTAGLDRNGMEMIIEFLLHYIENGHVLLFSTHDFEVACSLADHAIVLENGSIETSGIISEVFKTSAWLRSLR